MILPQARQELAAVKQKPGATGEPAAPGHSNLRSRSLAVAAQKNKSYQVRRMDNCKTRASYWLP